MGTVAFLVGFIAIASICHIVKEQSSPNITDEHKKADMKALYVLVPVAIICLVVMVKSFANVEPVKNSNSNYKSNEYEEAYDYFKSDKVYVGGHAYKKDKDGHLTDKFGDDD